MTGYSDRINHALAFAAKHLDQQVRRGTRPPYSTQPANIAIILTRYGRDEDTVTAGILLDVVRDYVREGFAADALQARIGEKFGARTLALALMAVERRVDDDGTELDATERRQDLIARLGDADEAGRVLVAAEALHAAGTILADLRRTVDPHSVWSRVAGGRERLLDGLRALHARLAALGVDDAIVHELGDTVAALAATKA